MANYNSRGTGGVPLGGGFGALFVLFIAGWVIWHGAVWVIGLFHHNPQTAGTALSVPACDAKPCPVPNPPPTPVTPLKDRPRCQVSDAFETAGDDCPSRIIDFADVDRALECATAKCFAQGLIALNQQPTEVVFPQGQAAQAQQAMRARVEAAVKVMGEALKEQATIAQDSLPELDALKDEIQSALEEARNIDQPVGETDDERRQRLGLGPNILKMARDVGN